MQYVTVSVVKQVPSYSKHCTKVWSKMLCLVARSCSCKILLLQVDDTKCKTVFKNAFTTQMETQVSRGGLIGRELLVRPNL